jgi:hypothetical protein
MQKTTDDFVLPQKATPAFSLAQETTHSSASGVRESDLPRPIGDFVLAEIKPLRFIGESIEVQFDQPPMLEKKPGCPEQFIWRGETYRVIEILQEWHDYSRRGRMAHNSDSRKPP